MGTQGEIEKMLAAEAYNCLDPALMALREQAQARLRRYNAAVEPAERRALLHALVGHCGTDSMIESPFHCSYGRHIYLGDHVYINVSCVILDNNEVRIGDHVMIGPTVQIYTAAHDLQAERRIQGWEVAKPVTVGDRVWIGGGAILLPGVSVGANAVVGAGAVVTRDVPANTVVAGNPARVIRRLDE